MRRILMILIAGFGLLSAMAESLAQEGFSCRSLWPVGAVGEYLGTTPCIEYDVRHGQFLALEGQHRVFHTPGWLVNEERRDLIKTVVQAVAESVEMLNDIAGRNRLGRITDTHTILGIEEFIEGWGSAAEVIPIRDLTFGEVCPILVDATAARRTVPAVLQQIIAHEIFHCLEHSNGYFPAANDDWWAEGAAEYFSNVIFPHADHEYSVSDVYDPSIRPVDHLPLDRRSAFQPYATVTFFQHLGNIAGPDWVMRRVFSLPRDPAPGAFHDELTGWPRIAESFQSFAERFKDQDIFDSAVMLAPGARTGQVLPIRPMPQISTTIIYADEGEQTETFEVAPFVFGERILVFANGKDFDIEVSTSDTAGHFRVRRPGEHSTWVDMPTRIRTNCAGDPQTYSLLATSTATVAVAARQPYIITMEITARDRDDCAFELLSTVPYNCHAETGGLRLDECLAGSWSMTEQSMVRSLWGSPPPPDSEYSHLDHSGSVQLAFDGSGTFVKQFDAKISHTKFDGTIMHKPIGHTVTDFQGSVSGCVTSQQLPIGPSYLVMSSDLVDNVTKHTYGRRDVYAHHVDRLDEGTPWNQWPRLQGAGKMRYACEGDTLTIGKREYRRIR